MQSVFNLPVLADQFQQFLRIGLLGSQTGDTETVSWVTLPLIVQARRIFSLCFIPQGRLIVHF